MFRFTLTLAFIGVVIWLYVQYVRPELAKHPRLAEISRAADTFWASVAARLRTWWDAILPVSLIALPEIADIVSQMLAAVNWASFQIAEGTKLAFQMFGIALAGVRAAIMRATAKTVDGA